MTLVTVKTLSNTQICGVNIKHKIMKVNMGMADRIGRIILAALVFILFGTGTITGTTAIILSILAGVFVLTGLIGFCPLYAPFKFSTKGKKQHTLKHAPGKKI